MYKIAITISQVHIIQKLLFKLMEWDFQFHIYKSKKCFTTQTSRLKLQNLLRNNIPKKPISRIKFTFKYLRHSLSQRLTVKFNNQHLKN